MKPIVGTLLLLTLLAFAMGGAAQDDSPPFIGINFAPDGASGVIITDIVPQSPAEAAELQPDDVIATIDNQIVTAANLSAIIRGYNADDTITLGIVRDGETLAVDLTLIPRPGDLTIPQPEPQSDLPPRPRMGIAVDSTEDNSGALVISVVPDSPADDAGIQIDDVITAVNGEPIANPTELIDQIGAYAPDDTVTIELERGEDMRSVDVILEEAPPPPPAPRTPQRFESNGVIYNGDGTWTIEGDNPQLQDLGFQAGDVITEIDGESIADPEVVFDLLADAMRRNSITLTVERDGEIRALDVAPTILPALLGAMMTE